MAARAQITMCISTVIHWVIGSTLAADSAALATALGHQLYARLLLESILFGTPKEVLSAGHDFDPLDHVHRCQGTL